MLAVCVEIVLLYEGSCCSCFVVVVVCIPLIYVHVVLVLKELKPTVDEDPTFGLVPRDLLREKHFENKFVAGDPHKFWYQEEQAIVSAHAHFTCFCKIGETFCYRIVSFVVLNLS